MTAASQPKNSSSVAEKVRAALKDRPFLISALSQGIVNYSAFARIIQEEVSPEATIDAIKAALLREAKTMKDYTKINEKKVTNVLKNSRLGLQDKVAVIISKNPLKIPYIVATDLTSNHIYIVDQTKTGNVGGSGISVSKNLVALILKSPEELEDLPGVLAFITQLLVSQEINIKELISCYTDTIILLEKGSGIKAFNLLQSYL
jgi:hypothetical protein